MTTLQSFPFRDAPALQMSVSGIPYDAKVGRCPLLEHPRSRLEIDAIVAVRSTTVLDSASCV